MSKMYQITEERLRELLEIEARYDALENGGVDNWEQYGAALSDFIEAYCDEPEVRSSLKDLESEGECTDDFWFEDVAELELSGYSVIEGN